MRDLRPKHPRWEGAAIASFFVVVVAYAGFAIYVFGLVLLENL